MAMNLGMMNATSETSSAVPATKARSGCDHRQSLATRIRILPHDARRGRVAQRGEAARSGTRTVRTDLHRQLGRRGTSLHGRCHRGRMASRDRTNAELVVPRRRRWCRLAVAAKQMSFDSERSAGEFYKSQTRGKTKRASEVSSTSGASPRRLNDRVSDLAPNAVRWQPV